MTDVQPRRFLIRVVCRHSSSGAQVRATKGKRRLPTRPSELASITWEDNESWMIVWAISECGPGREFMEEQIAQILLNERFSTWSNRIRMKPKASLPPEMPDTFVNYPIEDGTAEKAGALGGWRFECDSGLSHGC